MTQNDKSRNGVIIRKIILESVCGLLIRKANQLSQLATYLGARKNSMYECSKIRLDIEDREELVPLVKKLARKLLKGIKLLVYSGKLKSDNSMNKSVK